MSNIVVKDFTKDQLALIKSTVARGASDDELKLFLYRCESMGLDPLKPGQIYFIKYGTSPGTIVVGIDGFRAKAAATGKHAGTKRGLILGEDGKCVGAWCEVYRSDWKECAREESLMTEYNTGKAMWAKMPVTMIKKVAEAAALRMAFPDQLSGIYEASEMDQAEEKPVKLSDVGEVVHYIPPAANPYPVEPSYEEIANLGGPYIITFGKWKGLNLLDQDYREVKEYVKWIEREAIKKNKPIVGDVAQFIQRAEHYLENFNPEEMPGNIKDDLDELLGRK